MPLAWAQQIIQGRAFHCGTTARSGRLRVPFLTSGPREAQGSFWQVSAAGQISALTYAGQGGHCSREPWEQVAVANSQKRRAGPWRRSASLERVGWRKYYSRSNFPHSEKNLLHHRNVRGWRPFIGAQRLPARPGAQNLGQKPPPNRRSPRAFRRICPGFAQTPLPHCLHI